MAGRAGQMGDQGGSTVKKTLVVCLVLALVMLVAAPVLAAGTTGQGNPAKPPKALANPLLRDLKTDLAGFHRLRVQTANTLKQIASLNPKTKNALRTLKAQLKRLEPAERAAVIQSLRTTISGLKTQAAQVIADIKALRDQLKVKWGEFKAAVQSKNVEAARTALQSAISLQSRILDKAKALGSIKRQIWDAIKAVNPAKTS